MKKVIGIFSFILLMSATAMAQENQAVPTPALPVPVKITPEPATPAEAGPTTTIEFEETEFDFGTIQQGDKVEHVFKFKNTGTEPLIISQAKGSCGCTVPEYSKEPIAPGESSIVKVIFNSAGKRGMQTKPVTITANTNPAQTRVTLKGNVDVKEEPTAPSAVGSPVIAPVPAGSGDHNHPH